MNANTPTFDPLTATSAEVSDMVMGYCDGLAGKAPAGITSAAYDWSRKCGANDRAGVVHDDQRHAARALAGRIERAWKGGTL